MQHRIYGQIDIEKHAPRIQSLMQYTGLNFHQATLVLRGQIHARRDSKQPQNLAVNIDDGVAEILIYGEIGYNPYDDTGLTAFDIHAALEDAGDINSIVLRINSPGGDAYEGVAIYNLLRRQDIPVTATVDGIAASAASIIAMAADTITMNTGSSMMVHSAWGLMIGNANDARTFADILDMLDSSIADIYAAKTNHSVSDILDMMHAETWMSAQEAVEGAYADEVSEPVKAAVEMPSAHAPDAPDAPDEGNAPEASEEVEAPEAPDAPEVPEAPASRSNIQALQQWQRLLELEANLI